MPTVSPTYQALTGLPRCYAAPIFFFFLLLPSLLTDNLYSLTLVKNLQSLHAYNFVMKLMLN